MPVAVAWEAGIAQAPASHSLGWISSFNFLFRPPGFSDVLLRRGRQLGSCAACTCRAGPRTLSLSNDLIAGSKRRRGSQVSSSLGWNGIFWGDGPITLSVYTPVHLRKCHAQRRPAPARDIPSQIRCKPPALAARHLHVRAQHSAAPRAWGADLVAVSVFSGFITRMGPERQALR
jgi:hypothetical protein